MLLPFVSCSSSTNKIVEHETLIGEWELNSETQINYPLIEFYSDSTAIFRSKADTLYRYNFKLKEDSLILINNSNIISVNKILVLNDKQLVFDKLIEHKNKQTYKKVIYK